jgi:hypothetical protein
VAADDAAALAESYGLGRGTPVYYDMEAYSTARPGCSSAVLSFLDAWTSEIHHRGHASGVYGGAASAIADAAGRDHNPSFAAPDDVWFADWNGRAVTSIDSWFSGALWRDHRRLHQYEGSHDETWGGITMSIDNNQDDGLVAG